MILNIVVSAVLFYFSFPNFLSLQGFSFLSWFFAVPLFFALEGQNFFRRFLISLLFGLAANLLAVNWMIPYSFPGYILLSFVLSLQAVVFAGLYRCFQDRAILNLFYIPGAWVVSECLRKVIMLGESWDLAHCQTFDVVLMQIAAVFGSSSVSFVLIMMNYAGYLLLKRPITKANRFLYFGLWVFVILVYTYGFSCLVTQKTSEGEIVRIVALRTSHNYRGEIPIEKVHDIVNQNIALTRQAVMRMKHDLVIWPETSIPLDFRDDIVLKDKIPALAKEIKTNLLIGAVFEDDDGKHNSAVLLDKTGEVITVYSKRHLIPLTEFVPEGLGWRVLAKIFKIETPGLVPGRNSEPGVMEISVGESGEKVRFGVAICSEDNISRVFRDYYRRGAQFVVVLLNNGWFTQRAGFVMHGQHSMMRAAENRLPVVRSANDGLSGFIHESGMIDKKALAVMAKPGYDAKELRLDPHRKRIIADNNLFDTFCLLCLGFVIMMQFADRIKPFRER